MKRILICEYHQETNTFNPIINTVERFNAGDVFEGEALLKHRIVNKWAVGGAVDMFTEAGAESIPTIMMHSGSGGRVEDKAYEHMCDRLEHYVNTVGEFDGVYAALHGATCTESSDDSCGDLLEFIRKLVGDKPIAASCDMHAKITQKMLDNADIICGYRTYPHIDHYNVGRRAAKLLLDKLSGVEFHSAVCQIPVLVPPAGYTTTDGAYKQLMDKALAMIDDGTLMEVSIFPVQPWLDIDSLSSTVLAVAKDPAVAKEKAYELAKGLYEIRDEMWPDMKPVDEIIEIAEKNETEMPVVLADSADSPNGGCVGDSPMVAMRLQERGSTIKAAMFIRDEEAVKQAFALGEGASAEFSVGAGLTPGVPGPFKGEGTVLHLFENDNKTGKHPVVGRAATVRFGNIYIVIGENGFSSPHPDMFDDFGVEALSCRLLVVKANTSFRYHYGKISNLLFVADTPGAGASNLRAMQWKNLPKGIYPIDLPEDYKVEQARLW